MSDILDFSRMADLLGKAKLTSAQRKEADALIARFNEMKALLAEKNIELNLSLKWLVKPTQ